ncbi:amino acid ABC transporter permease [Xylophilus sp. GOD-11R]|uniref:amino acid ABC transporter permease n=1 Tax=Xylophilus sp. GOD-11R TaxID=3089814 RepID=UPI00298D43ED|nr:amino acid ABC transporter permease [Xylophilus sp. GOD-11R]WPB56449.1 amino acid ABC transporter permease [Xylophilus sp. GOD-11R]
MDAFLLNFFNLEILALVWPQLMRGLLITLQLSAVVVPLGLAVGLLVASAQSFGQRWVDIALIGYVDFLRAFPPLVLLVFAYYALPFLGIELSTFMAVVLALVLNTSAYFAEVFRAGIESIPRGQVEASRSTGLTTLQTLVHVVLPQAVRKMLPDLVSNILETVKLTSLASVVTLPELLRVARMAQGNTFNATPLVAAALIYLALLWPVVRVLSRMEKKSLAGAR